MSTNPPYAIEAINFCKVGSVELILKGAESARVDKSILMNRQSCGVKIRCHSRLVSVQWSRSEVWSRRAIWVISSGGRDDMVARVGAVVAIGGVF